jgi:hypothetical protein
MIEEELVNSAQHIKIINAIQILLFVKSYVDNISETEMSEQINLKITTKKLIEKAIDRLNL